MGIALPLALRTSLESGESCLFLGAGIGYNMHDPEGNPAPTGAKLAEELAARFRVPFDEDSTLPEVAQVVEARAGRPELDAFVVKRLANLEPDEDLLWLFSLRWRAIFTTNYDGIIRRSYDLLNDPPQEPVFFFTSQELALTDPRYEVPVFYLHGSVGGPHEPNLVITEDDFARFATRRMMLFGALRQVWAQGPFLYIGYSNSDQNWKLIHHEMRSEFSPKPLPLSYRVAPSTGAAAKELLRTQRIETLDLDLHAFHALVADEIGSQPADPGRWSPLEAQLPPDLREPFERSPAGVARLLNSWEYVNQADFSAEPNIEAYLRGALPNWSLAASDQMFERDVEEPLLEALFDFATSPKATQRTLLVTGSAGFGMTSVLMATATSLVKEHAGRVFMLKRGRPLLVADIQFASALFEEPPFFVIDNAANIAPELPGVLQRLKEVKISACLLLGERQNEWALSRPRLQVERFEIEALSDGEIARLLGYLEEHDALGVLKDLPDDLRVTALRERHQKQLLVAMREATEGEEFDAILENEYRGINDSFSQRAYAIVCCFYRLRGMARDNLLAEMMGCELTDLYSNIRDSTEGVIYWDPVDEANGIYAARARHHVIADVVWQRVVPAGEKEALTRSALQHLNLNFPIDARAFEQFTRMDVAVDSIETYEGKVQFFEDAAKKDPLSHYVRQHFARMLRREGHLELALAEIDRALELREDAAILHHTRGLILNDLALRAESLDVGRRWVYQSESAFRNAIRLQRRNEYGYHSLARLYFDWAQKAGDDEGANYLAKAEELISEGLREARDPEYLWVLSSQIEAFVGDNKQALAKLESAVQAAPGGTYGRLALGRHYRRAGEPEKAIEVLKPIIENNPNEFRAVIECALSMHDLDLSLPEIIAILRLGTLYGYGQPRFVAMLGGLLFLQEEYSDAATVFRESDKRVMSLSQRQRVEFHPHERGSLNPIWITGEVTYVGAGYSFISVPGGRVFCHGSKYGALLMRAGKKVRFRLAFSARGPVALSPEEA